jgi:CRP/FNR family transcriptional regulator, cyclic AMP receptor protein
MAAETLGKTYYDGDIILREGQPAGDVLYLIQSGRIEVIKTAADGQPVLLGQRGKGEFFGEMELFESEPCYATVRALGTVRLLTIDRKTLFRQILDDPATAIQLVKGLSGRIRMLSEKVTRLEHILQMADARVEPDTPAAPRAAEFSLHVEGGEMCMSLPDLMLCVRRPQPGVALIDLHGQITAGAEPGLNQVLRRTTAGHLEAVIVNFSGLNAISSGGLSLLFALLAQVYQQSFAVRAFGLRPQHRVLLELTRLDHAIAIFASEADALADVTS